MNRSLLSKFIIIVLALPALLLPGACLAYILFKGLPVLSGSFIFSATEGLGFGVSSGVLAQLLGSLLLALAASLLATPFALGTAFYYCLYASKRQQTLLAGLLNMLQSIPPIVFGLFGLIVFVHLLQWGVSLLSGAVILAMVILPMLVLNSIASLERIPAQYTEAAQSLGLHDGAIISRVWLAQAWPGILTGQLLGIARALSETAPILFTATVFSGVVWPASIFSPVTTLQTHIFYLAQEGSRQEVIQVAWGSAVVLLGLVAVFALLARYLASRYENSQRLGVE